MLELSIILIFLVLSCLWIFYVIKKHNLNRGKTDKAELRETEEATVNSTEGQNVNYTSPESEEKEQYYDNTLSLAELKEKLKEIEKKRRKQKRGDELQKHLLKQSLNQPRDNQIIPDKKTETKPEPQNPVKEENQQANKILRKKDLI